MSKFTVQRYCTKNDSNGNPRRVFVIRNDSGSVVRTVAEGYEGRHPLYRTLESLGVPIYSDGRWTEHQDNPDTPSWTDLGDVDVSPGVYRRMLNYRIGQVD
jgi:hypothetical protein